MTAPTQDHDTACRTDEHVDRIVTYVPVHNRAADILELAYRGHRQTHLAVLTPSEPVRIGPWPGAPGNASPDGAGTQTLPSPDRLSTVSECSGRSRRDVSERQEAPSGSKVALVSSDEEFLLACYRKLPPIRQGDVRRFIAHLVWIVRNLKHSTSLNPVL
jgi:hypothetical protein